ncbi:lysophosphatidylserine lipase ABHD12-like isoform X2 [Hypomesus transpacificus]|uniref:lysophosphatidylserine lipase ABHD12-like isoform X2 n=1 Tax=Hypomesus transpacificus TaxID=137520 RepID=UPI001F0728B4|nr:lysophosphatidylserine lipase ABHD12-like isoform X2 [Hypomesus transpacificus]
MSSVKMRNRRPNTADSNADSTPELKQSKQSQQKTAKGRQPGCRSLLILRTKRIALLLCTVYISVPVVVYLFPWILGHVIYLHLLRFPFFADLAIPSEFLNYTTNFHLSPEEGVSVGVWHTLPVSQWEQAEGRGPEWHRGTLGDGRPVIIYLHGNTGTRALSHRVNLVKILSAAGYHVLSLDYRGYGDSSGEPTEAGLTTDALYLYRWVKQRSRSLVFLWGHSLGTGVTTNVALREQQQGSRVDAVILEAPYTNMGKAAECHPISMMYMFIPGFKSLLWKILEMNNIVFPNDKNLETLACPVLILHSEDDNVIPHHMGQELYNIALQAERARNAGDHVEMVTLPASLGYSHNYIYMDPSLTTVVGGFLQRVKQK